MKNNFSLSEAQLFNKNYQNNLSEFPKHKYFFNNHENSTSLNPNVNFDNSDDFLEFLKTNYRLNDNLEEIMLFFREYFNLIDVIPIVSNLFFKEFPNDLLEMKIISRIDEEKFLAILVHTNIDGFSASKKIEKIEDDLYNRFGNVFEKIIISAEFFK